MTQYTRIGGTLHCPSFIISPCPEQWRSQEIFSRLARMEPVIILGWHRCVSPENMGLFKVPTTHISDIWNSGGGGLDQIIFNVSKLYVFLLPKTTKNGIVSVAKTCLLVVLGRMNSQVHNYTEHCFVELRRCTLPIIAQ